MLVNDCAQRDRRPSVVAESRRLLADEYRAPHSWPWVIGYSGGKDSSAVLQLAFETILALPPRKRTRPVHVICTDTMVEIPSMAVYVRALLDRIQVGARALGVPLTTHMLEPDPDKTFWTLLLGKGYPAPHKHFRWCTDKLKIQPATSFIREVAEQHGGALLLLGSRKSESASRARSIERHTVNESRYNPHSSVEKAHILRPIEDFETREVWDYLLQNPPPWGGTNRDLITLYRNAGAHYDEDAPECPLVVDKSTPSCGNSRFGCWTCTVVKQDHSLEALLDNGQEWAAPMLDFREELIRTRDDPAARMAVRRNGQEGPGPYTFETRKHLLALLLGVQEKTGMSLISAGELARIEAQWREDERTLDRREVAGLWEQQPMLLHIDDPAAPV